MLAKATAASCATHGNGDCPITFKNCPNELACHRGRPQVDQTAIGRAERYYGFMHRYTLLTPL